MDSDDHLKNLPHSLRNLMRLDTNVLQGSNSNDPAADSNTQRTAEASASASESRSQMEVATQELTADVDWADLTPQLVQAIMDLLPPHEARKLRAVCAAWRRGAQLPTPTIKLAVTRKLVKAAGHLPWLLRTFPAASSVELRLEHTSDATFRQAVKQLRGLKSLRQLTLNSCCGAAQMSWAMVTSLTGVSSLHAHGVCMGYQECQALPKMTALKELCLRCLYMDESCLPALSRCRQLMSLSLSFDNITWDASSALEVAADLLAPLKALTSLRSLELHCRTWPELAELVMEWMPHLTTFYQIQLGADFNLESCSQWDRKAAALAKAEALSTSTTTSTTTNTGYSSHVPRPQTPEALAGAKDAAAGAAAGELVVRSYDLVLEEQDEHENVGAVLRRVVGRAQLDMLAKLKVGMAGSRPSFLQGLEALTTLTNLFLLHIPADLGAAQLEPRPLSAVFGPSSLQQLKVQSHYDDNTPGSFVLTDVCFAALARSYPKLTKLEFDGGMVHAGVSFSELSRLTALKELHLTHDEHGAPPSVSAAHLPPSLMHVTIMSMNLIGPPATQLPELLSLDLEWSVVQDLGIFAGAPQLQELYLWHCDVATPLQQLPALFPELRVLSLNDVHSHQQLGWASMEQFQHVAELKALRALTWITPSAALGSAHLQQLRQLPALRELALAPGSDTGIEDFRGLSQLTGLHKIELRLGLLHERHRQLLAHAQWQQMLVSLDRAMPASLVTFTRDPADLTT